MKTPITIPAHLENSWLFSPSFVKRAFAIYGYCICAVLMLYGVFLAFFLVLALFGAMLGLI